jgi:two-component system alkaline phosphatase synthesis response regulator PhoP
MQMAGHVKILVVDDEPDILEFLEYNLKKEGFLVFLASNGREAVESAMQIKPDLIIMDVLMPVMDGIEACTRIREIQSLKNTFILFLTARSEEYTEIAGFNAGGDDYMSKPVKPRVLLSRIEAILRRKPEKVMMETNLQNRDIIIDRESYTVVKDGTTIPMARKEFELLFLLASKPGKVFTREIILGTVWGSEIHVGERTIDVHIRKLRLKVGEDRITTIKGVGYKLEK